MRKKLIAAIAVLLFLFAAAVGMIIYMEIRPGENKGDASEVTEETVGLSLPTEDPGEVAPEDSFGDEDFVPPFTGSYENTGESESPDANETPEDIF